MRVINTSDLRNNIANVLNSVYLDNESYEVKRSGLTVATITRPGKIKNQTTTKPSAWKFNGIFANDNDFNAKKLINHIHEGRKDEGKLKRKLPKL